MMFNENLTNECPEKSPCTLIYEAAKREDKKTIDQLLSQGISINVQEGLKTPLFLASSEGNHIAVDFLLKNYCANVDEATLGYAFKNDYQKVEEFVSIRKGSIISAGRGYALSNNTLKVKEFIENNPSFKRASIFKTYDFKKNKENEFYSYLTLLDGHACMGRVERVNQILADLEKWDGAFDLEIHQRITTFFILVACNIYALCGHHNPFQELQKKYQLINFIRAYPLFIKCYATGGFIERVREYIELDQSPNKITSVTAAVLGYAKGGHSIQVEKLMTLYPTLINYLVPIAINNYIKHEHINHAEKLYNLNSNISMTLVMGSIHTHPSRAMRLLSFTSNTIVRQKITDSLLTICNVMPDKEASLKAVHLKSIQLNQCMQEKKINYNQALAWSTTHLAWFLSGFQWAKKNNLSPDIFYLIFSFLPPISLTFHESEDLFQKMTLDINKKLCIHDIKKITSISKFSFFIAKEDQFLEDKAKHLIKNCQLVTSNKELSQVLTLHKDIFFNQKIENKVFTMKDKSYISTLLKWDERLKKLNYF